jgi:hypothetical protein
LNRLILKLKPAEQSAGFSFGDAQLALIATIVSFSAVEAAVEHLYRAMCIQKSGLPRR